MCAYVVHIHAHTKHWHDIGERLTKNYGILKIGLSAILAVALSLFSVALVPRNANASANDLSISDAQQAVKKSKYSLTEAESKLASLSSECEQLQAEIDEMQVKVNELADQTIAAQEAMLAGRESLSEAMQYEYRNSSVAAMLGVVFGSSDWTQFTKGVDYISSIMDSQAAEVEKQKQLKAELEEVSTELTNQKDEQEAKLSELETKRDEAQEVVNQVSDEVAANTEKLEKLKAQADAIAKSTQSTANATTGGTTNAGGGGGNRIPSSTGGGPSDTGNVGTHGGWVAPMSTSTNSGYATAYDLPGNLTASGIRYTNDILGVAIDIHTPGYRDLVNAHRSIQISYGGRTVVAQIIDGGGFAGYGTSLDLMHAVYTYLDPKATSAIYWGKRTVTYRLL